MGIEIIGFGPTEEMLNSHRAHASLPCFASRSRLRKLFFKISFVTGDTVIILFDIKFMVYTGLSGLGISEIQPGKSIVK